MKFIVVVAIVVLALQLDRTPIEQAQVARVIDGDTLVLVDGRRVRLLQVDAPEHGQCGYDLAKRELRKYEGREVGLEQDQKFGDRDRYGRLLRYVHVDGVVLNVQLQKEGLVDSMFYQGKHGKYAYQMSGHGSCAT